MTETIRTFIAFKLPGSVLSALAGLQEEIRALGVAMKWVKPRNIHLTLKFLGNIRQTDAARVESAIRQAAAGFRPMTARAEGLGVFPDRRRPRVLWVGIKEEMEPLAALQGSLENRLEAIGFPKEKRAFQAHLTLARAKGPVDARAIDLVSAQFGGFQSEPFLLDRLFLLQSRLTPAGSVYSDLAGIPLGG